MTASMDYCRDNDLGLLDSEVDSEGKASSAHGVHRDELSGMSAVVRQRVGKQKVLRPRIRARDPRVTARTMKQLLPDLGPPLP
jgi:hypothetical protein